MEILVCDKAFLIGNLSFLESKKYNLYNIKAMIIPTTAPHKTSPK